MKTTFRMTILLLLSAPLLFAAAKPTQEADTKRVAATPAPTAGDAVTQPVLESEPTMPTPVSQTASNLPAQTASVNANYVIDWYSINGGGTVEAASTNYRMGASVGQSVAGAASSTNYRMGIGFWYGAGGQACACNCHGDPGGPCDGFTNILDVTQVVNAAFRNYPPMIDPNANCPHQTPDVNCSGDPEVLDVVKMVNVAFRNGNPATEFCNPCP